MQSYAEQTFSNYSSGEFPSSPRKKKAENPFVSFQIVIKSKKFFFISEPGDAGRRFF